MSGRSPNRPSVVISSARHIRHRSSNPCCVSIPHIRRVLDKPTVCLIQALVQLYRMMSDAARSAEAARQAKSRYLATVSGNSQILLFLLPERRLIARLDSPGRLPWRPQDAVLEAEARSAR